MNISATSLAHYLAQDAQRPVPEPLHRLVAVLQEQYGTALAAVLFYGSCLRTGEVADGVVDLHVIIDDYAAYNHRLLAYLNRWLPPNVFYLRIQNDSGDLRAKYNVFALRDLPGRVTKATLDSFVWARLAQRVAVLYARDAESLARVHALRAEAVRTFARAVGPLAGSPEDPRQFWQRALELTFRSELRAESPERATQLVDADADYFEAVTARLPCDTVSTGPQGRRRARGKWILRAVTGKLLSLLRLAKGAYTFDGGLDYIVWKLERHSGRRIDVPERVRRHPGIFIWGFAWRLYRQGVFR